MLEFKIIGQSLTRIDRSEPSSDSEEYLQAKFKFEDADWEGKVKTALFRIEDTVYKAIVNARTNSCTVPAEVLAKDNSRYAKINGTKFYISVIAELDTTRITTNEVEIKLKASGYGEALTPAAPTATEYQQLSTLYEEAFEECEQVIVESQKARADLVGVKNIFANAVKGKLKGAIVTADDVSPLEHEPIIKVHGKNLAKTFVNESAGTGYANCLYIDGDIQPNTTYTISFVGAADHTIYFNENITTVYTWLECTGERQFITITTKPDISSQYYSGKGYAIARNNPGNTVVPNFSNVQIEEGNEATEYEAYIDPSKVSVIRCGKNLLKSIATTRTIDGITFTVNTDKSVKANGKSTSTAPIRYLLGEATLPPGVYLISGQSEGTGSTFIMYSDQDGNFNQQHSGQDSALIVTKTATINVYLVVLESAMVSNIKIFPMIRLAPCTDKTYETYNGAEYTPSSNGTVEAITSLSPNMTILTDTEGAVVECEYIKDTNKVIEKLVNAITALGGNVTI